MLYKVEYSAKYPGCEAFTESQSFKATSDKKAEQRADRIIEQVKSSGCKVQWQQVRRVLRSGVREVSTPI